jgi:hypothetical protein
MNDNRLLDLIDELTKPDIDHISQTTDDGTYLRTVTIEHPPLLQQLADAVIPSAGNDAGSKSASARERNILDADALNELVLIQNQLFEWCQLERIRGDRHNLPATLRKWYTAYNTTNHEHEIDRWHERELSRWVRTIRSRLDRSIKEADTGRICPLCTTAKWVDMHGDRQPARLIIRYRVDDNGDYHDERTICQRCKTEWTGVQAMEELRDELNERMNA